MALLSKKVDYNAFKGAYCDEQLDRQVLWILKQIPELDFENKKIKGKGNVKESERGRVSFECGKTGFFISLFFVHLQRTFANVCGEDKDFNKMVDQMDSNHGCLTFNTENSFQQELFSILKVDDFQKYYKTLGLERA